MGKSVLSFLAVILIIAILTATALLGLDLGVAVVPSVQEGVRLGLDLVGGSLIVFQAEIPDGMSATEIDSSMRVAERMLRLRLDSFGYTEATVSASRGNRLRVEIPNVADPEEAIALLGSTASLEFRMADGEVVLTGADVQEARVEISPVEDNGPSVPHVVLTFKPESRAKFTDATRRAAAMSAEGNNYIAIALDGEVREQPYVDAAYATTGINTENATVTMGSGQNAAQAANEFAQLINIGQLPFDLANVEQRTVGPTLGERSLQTSVTAGLIGLGLVILFMGVFYRVPGLMADIALILYTVLMVVIMAALRVNLSLPGIAGIILSVGMAVDANVVIFERLKEELRAGKTIRSAVDSSFRRALSAIIDSNVTTVIAAIVLMWQGTGPIQGFAVTLLIGVLLSMFSAVVVTRFLLRRLTDMNFKSLKAFGL